MDGAELKQFTWKTAFAADAVKLNKSQENLLPLIRLGIAAFPESTIMKLTFMGAATLGLPPDKSAELHNLLTRRYEIIGKDPLYGKTPSALPYCFSKDIQ